MDYYDYPVEKTGLFEPSDRNYYWTAGKYTYLCSQEEMDRIDPWIDFRDAFVLYRCLRCAVVEKGGVTFSNDDAVSRWNGKAPFFILRSEPVEYRIDTWGNRKLRSFEIRSEKGRDSALNPLYFRDYRKALKTALSLSGRYDCRYMVAVELESYDRH